jgi:hypothetical protein
MARFPAVLVLNLCLLFLPLHAQELDLNRDSIPQALRQPQRGEAPRYPRDLVIGSLERGNVPAAVRRAALEIMAALSAGNGEAPALSSIGPMARGELLASLEEIRPRAYRVGEGREEPDGSCSFLVRFLGREMGIAGELYLRFRPPQPEAAEASESSPSGAGAWVLDDLLLEEKRRLGEIVEEPIFDLPPYERLY